MRGCRSHKKSQSRNTIQHTKTFVATAYVQRCGTHHKLLIHGTTHVASRYLRPAYYLQEPANTPDTATNPADPLTHSHESAEQTLHLPQAKHLHHASSRTQHSPVPIHWHPTFHPSLHWIGLQIHIRHLSRACFVMFQIFLYHTSHTPTLTTLNRNNRCCSIVVKHNIRLLFE